jgi:hypothetical protein
MPTLPSGKIGKPLFEQGFFYGVYAGGSEYVLKPCSMPNTGKLGCVALSKGSAHLLIMGISLCAMPCHIYLRVRFGL